MQILTHGSEDSLDHDVYVIFDHIPTFQEAKSYCNSLDGMNPNILFVKNGLVDWCFKGTVDECNNSLFMTYALHEQTHTNPIAHRIERDFELKLIRTFRGILSYFSRTEHRIAVKKALRSSSFEEKLSVMRSCQLSLDTDYKKATHIEVFKFYAFQLGQTLALLEDGIELFTKSSVAEHYPELRPYLYREAQDPTALQDFLTRFLNWSETHLQICDEKDTYLLNCLGATEETFRFEEVSKF